jgi:septal ring factor EnvC (AmiA/AmiB activator)
LELSVDAKFRHAFRAMNLRPLPGLVFTMAILCALPTGCSPKSDGPDLAPEVTRLTLELEAAKRKTAEAENAVSVKNDELALAAANSAGLKMELAARDEALAKTTAELTALKTSMAELKERDAAIFTEISAMQKKGMTTVALSAYRQFVKEYPQSPLVPHATRAIAELTAAEQKEEKWRASIIDPKRQEREVLQNFKSGFATLEEVAPLVKGKSSAYVSRLLGAPHRTYREGTEFGYLDSVTDPATGTKATLVIAFDEKGDVSSLRVGYQGRPVKP